MVSHPDQFIKAKEMMRGWGIDVDNVALGIMMDSGSAIIIEDFLKAGIKFASFGTNDLIQYTIAITGTTRMLQICITLYPGRSHPDRQFHPAMPRLWCRVLYLRSGRIRS